jgi:hypothetical protein
MDKSELRAFVFEALRRNAQSHFNALELEIKRLTPDYHRSDALKLQEVIWDLLKQGILAPGKNSLNLHLPFFHVTAYGARCLEEEALLLHDPDDYLKRLEKSVGPSMDETVLNYVRESVLSFLAGRDFAAMSLLGTASERCVDLLIETYLNTLTDKRKKTHFKRKARLSGRRLKPRFETLKQVLLAAPLPTLLSENLDLLLDGLYSLTRFSRKESGEPTVQSPDRETAHAQLLLFPQYCEHVQALIRYLKKGPA